MNINEQWICDTHNTGIQWMGQRNPAPVGIGGKHPIIYRLSTIRLLVQEFATITSTMEPRHPNWCIPPLTSGMQSAPCSPECKA